MRTVIKKEDLLNIINNNKKRHESMYKDSVRGYVEEARKQLKEELNKVKTNVPNPIYIILTPPQNYSAQYDRAIRMIELNIAEQIEVEETEFSNLVMDDWEWTQDWINSNRKFSKIVDQYGVVKGI